MKSPHVSGSERVLIYILFACVDFVQIIFSLFVVTEVLNNVIDFLAGGFLLAYGMKRKLWTGQKILVLAAVFVGEQIPFINAFPFWVLDVANLYSGVPKERPQEEGSQNQYLNENGLRQPQIEQPLNNDGVRLPRQ